jgi:hypothetical protein
VNSRLQLEQQPSVLPNPARFEVARNSAQNHESPRELSDALANAMGDGDGQAHCRSDRFSRRSLVDVDEGVTSRSSTFR